MDDFLIDYLRSGQCYLFIGSGPSCQMGYPSWEELASFAVSTVKIEGQGYNLKVLNKAMKRRDFPHVFNEAKK